MIISTHHKIVELIEQGKFVLTNARTMDYMSLLTYPDVLIKIRSTVNPAERIPFDFEGEAHDCVAEALIFTKLRPDLESIPLIDQEGDNLESYFVDGSCFKDYTGNHAGFAVVKQEGKAFTEEILHHIPVPEGPFRHIVMDYVDMIKPIRGKRYMLVIIDRFSRWVEAIPSVDQGSGTVVKFLSTEVIPRFGIPFQTMVQRLYKKL